MARLHDDVARTAIDDCLILGREVSGALVRFDPISAVIVDALDGTTDLDELAEDLSAAAGLTANMAASIIDGLVDALVADGIVVGEPPEPRLPRHPYAAIPPESCAGRRMGLSRSAAVEIWGYGQPFRVRSTLPEALEGITGSGERPEGALAGMETFTLRATRPGRVRRRQQLFDTTGEVLHVAHDLERAVEALRRTVQARMELSWGGAWLDAVAVDYGDRVVVLHPTLAQVVLDRERELETHGLGLVAGTLFELSDDRWVRLPAPVGGNGRERRLMLTAVALPEPPGDTAGNLREFLLLARCWDQVHFDVFGRVGRSLPFRGIRTDTDVIAQLAGLGD